jgi:Trypsin-like peptidase domain
MEPPTGDVSNTTPFSLLREWDYPTSQTPATETSFESANVNIAGDDSECVVPVAPAVVVLPSTAATQSRGMTYPVATFVSNLVRQGMDTISETAVAAVTRADFTFRANIDDADFVLVDGDLVAIQNTVEERSNDEDEDDCCPPCDEKQHHQTNPFPSFGQRTRWNLRKRLKGVRKWIKKRGTREFKDDRNVESQNQTDRVDEESPPVNTTSHSQVGASTSATGNHPPKRKLKSQRRRTWSQNHGDLLNADEESQNQNPTVNTPVNREEIGELNSLRYHQVETPDHSEDFNPPRLNEATVVPSENPEVAAVNAHFIGSVEQVLQSGGFTDVAPAVAFIESDKDDDHFWAKKNNDKVVHEEVALDNMLQQARYESSSSSEDDDLAESVMMMKKPPRLKVDDSSQPLSESINLDSNVWNDLLKVVLVGGNQEDKSALGRALAGKRPKRAKHTFGLDVHTWQQAGQGLKFSLWDIHSAYAGLHPATQSLFFSGNSLYLLLWDVCAANMPSTDLAVWIEKSMSTARITRRVDYEDDDDDDDNDNEFLQEELSRAAERAMELHISDNVLSWLDCISYTCGSAILPVAVISNSSLLSKSEKKRRCDVLRNQLINHPAFGRTGSPLLIFGNDDSIVDVSLDTGEGIPELQDIIHAIGKEQVFPHFASTVDRAMVEVYQLIRRLKRDHKVIMLDHLLSEMDSKYLVEKVQDILSFLSDTGEIMYFGNSKDHVLSKFIILCRKWLISALSCILRPDLQRELEETRGFMNIQCVYSGESYHESDVVQTLLKGTNSSCPIVSAKDSAMLWKSMSFMREAADRTVQLSQASSTMYDFLERLLVYSGIFMPLTISQEHTYFVPSLLNSAAAAGVWTYKSSESWITTLCHSWLLREATPPSIMEHVTTCLLQDLYEFAHTFQGKSLKPVKKAKMYPLGAPSMAEFMDIHNHEAIGRIKIHQVVCWKSCLLVKIGTVFAETGQNELRESFVEIFVALVDEQSEYCVSTHNMSNAMKRLIVCGKGQLGHHGRKLWQGGFALVVNSLRASMNDATGSHREVVCPECLAHSHPRIASTWSWDTVQAANEIGNAGLRCTRGHLVDTFLLCGVCSPSLKPHPRDSFLNYTRHRKPVSKLLPSVVLVAVWNDIENTIHSVGSGFIVDKKLGLIVTAGHVLFDMIPSRKFGTLYFGLASAKAIIGIMPEDGENKAVFRYFAEIVSHDIEHIDACVLRITTKLEHDVDGDNCTGVPEILIKSSIKNENLPSLKLSRTFELEESIRILGYNQGGEGILEKGKHVNRSADFAKGYICKRFVNRVEDDSSTSSKGSSSSSIDRQRKSFVPREEIVVMCPTISGHSGGPCVNEEGRVLGILSRADPVDRQRCYIVPTSEIKELVSRAKSIDSLSWKTVEIENT